MWILNIREWPGSAQPTSYIIVTFLLGLLRSQQNILVISDRAKPTEGVTVIMSELVSNLL
jgi:hypothetical protein